MRETDALLDELLVEQPALRGALTELHEAAVARVALLDEALLAASEARIAELLGLEAPSPVVALTDAAQACLAFTEQFVLDVVEVADVHVAELVRHLGADGAADFVNALLVVEQRLRMRATWNRLGLGIAS